MSWPEGRLSGEKNLEGSFSSRRIRSPYGGSTLRTAAFGAAVFESHHTVFTEALARILRLLTHSVGDGSCAGLCQQNSSARKSPHASHRSGSTRRLNKDRTGT